MADRRHATGHQALRGEQAGVRAREDLVLAEAGIEDPIVFEEDPGTSSRLHPLQRPKFRELLTCARPGDTVHISEMSASYAISSAS
ncbi:hypothetical protein [Streptomyces hebeiensis]